MAKKYLEYSCQNTHSATGLIVFDTIFQTNPPFLYSKTLLNDLMELK